MEFKVTNTINPNEQIIDMTPDGEYALRILKYYRNRAEEKISGSSDNIVFEMVNKAQDKRAIELDLAIEKLLFRNL